MTHVPRSQRDEVVNPTRNECFYCLRAIPGLPESFVAVDHIIAMGRGGEDEARNRAVACFGCNSGKSDKLVREWVSGCYRRPANADAAIEYENELLREYVVLPRGNRVHPVVVGKRLERGVWRCALACGHTARFEDSDRHMAKGAKTSQRLRCHICTYGLIGPTEFDLLDWPHRGLIHAHVSQGVRVLPV